jgi:hypothetical protein
VYHVKQDDGGHPPEPHLEKVRNPEVPTDEEDAAIDHIEEAGFAQSCPFIHCSMLAFTLAVQLVVLHSSPALTSPYRQPGNWLHWCVYLDIEKSVCYAS